MKYREGPLMRRLKLKHLKSSTKLLAPTDPILDPENLKPASLKGLPSCPSGRKKTLIFVLGGKGEVGAHVCLPCLSPSAFFVVGARCLSAGRTNVCPPLHFYFCMSIFIDGLHQFLMVLAVTVQAILLIALSCELEVLCSGRRRTLL